MEPARSTGWTGGQYSVWRAGVGFFSAVLWCALALRVDPEPHAWIFRIAGGPGDAVLRSRVTTVIEVLAAVAGVLFAIGRLRRPSAVVLAVAFFALAPPARAVPPAALAAAAWLLHVPVPAAPYGSVAAAGRADPRGGWHMPRAVPWLARVALIVLVWRIAVAREPGDLLALVLIAPGALDPGWIPPRSAATAEHMFYDGTCGLCHRFVRFVLAEDTSGRAFRFAPLGGEAFRASVPEQQRGGLPDSIVIVDASGDLLVRSRAARHVLARLGGLWRVIAGIGGVMPVALADRVYDAVARVRHRFFTPPEEGCPLVTEELGGRFDT